MFDITPDGMDRDPALAQDRHGGDAGGDCRSASRSPGCWRASDFWGKSLLDARRASAAGAAAGRDRLSAADRVRPPGSIGAFLADHLGIVFAFRWTGAALACGVMAFPLLVRADPAVDRGDRPPARGRRRDARRRRRAGCSSPSRCRWRCPACSPAWCSASPRRSASSARPSPSSPTFPARRRPSRPRSTP